MGNIEKLNSIGFNQTATAILYNNNFLPTLRPLIEILNNCPIIESIIVLEEYSTDGSLDWLSSFNNYKIKVIKNYNTIDRAQMLTKIGYTIDDTDWILYFKPYDVLLESDIELIYQACHSDNDGIEFNYKCSCDYEFRGIRTPKFKGFINDLIPELRKDLSVNPTSIVLSHEANEEVAKKDYKKYIKDLVLYKNKERFTHPEYWLNAYKYETIINNCITKEAKEYLNKAETLVNYFDNPNPYTYIDIMAGKGMNYMNSKNKEKAWECFTKVMYKDSYVRIDLAYYIFENFFKDVPDFSELDKNNKNYWINAFINDLDLYKEGNKERYKSMYFLDVWQKFIPNMISYLYQYNTELSFKLYNKVKEINPDNILDNYIKENQKWF